MYKPVKPVANIIIGAGPAGVQLGYFFQKAGLDYVILERNEFAGSFFDRYPLSGQLISINKRFTGVDDADFNLRHDWNSLLSDDGPKFTEYSKEYYPDSKDLVRYINDFAAKYKLNIKYKTNVDRISKIGENGYAIAVTDSTGKWLYRCNALIVATGLGLPSRDGIRDESVVKVKHYAEYEKDYFKKPENLKKFENKSVLILGTGNAGFELGNLLTPYCSRINVQGRSVKKWAMATHYAGDLRSIYLPYYDTFLLKSLNAFEKQCSGKPNIIITQADKESKYKILSEDSTCNRYDNDYVGYDHVILCTGWTFDSSIFDFDLAITPNRKYPIIGRNYESTNNKKLFFIGSLMHSNDYKQSSGGFIHGFRYLIEYFFHLNYDGKFDIINFTNKNLNSLVNHILYRINYSSSIYQMYGQIVDLFIYNTKTKMINYINNVHPSFIRSPSTDVDLVYFILSLEYSKTENDNISQLGVRNTSIGTESNAILLHPIIRVLKDVQGINKALVDAIHFDEDLFADFTGKMRYSDKLMRTLKMYIN
jgi:thioredoxin reductase